MALTDNLSAYHKLDESSGDAADATGNGNTLTNTNTVAYGAALINNGADFGAANTNKVLKKTTSIVANAGTSLSLQVWVKLKAEIASGVWTFISDFKTAGGTNAVWYTIDYEFNAGTPRLKFIRDRNGAGQDSGTYTITLGTANWYHLVLTYDATTVKGYVNAVERASFASSGIGTADNGDGAGVGARVYAGGATVDQFSSSITDESGRWTRGLTPTEVTQLYNGGNGLAYPLTVASAANTRNFFTLLGVN